MAKGKGKHGAVMDQLKEVHNFQGAALLVIEGVLPEVLISTEITTNSAPVLAALPQLLRKFADNVEQEYLHNN